MLLPHIRPIGDIDVEELALDSLIADALGQEGGGSRQSRRRIPAFYAKLLLRRIIMKWSRRYVPAPREPGHAAHLARELARLIDQVHTEDLSFDGLRRWSLTTCPPLAKDPRVSPDRHQEWPAVLDRWATSIRRRLSQSLLAALADHWRRAPPQDPIVAAGSTGSIPATATLLSVDRHLPNGSVVCPDWIAHWTIAAWQ